MAIETHGDERFESPEVGIRPLLFTAIGVLILLVGAIGGFAAIYYWQVPVQTLPAPEKFPQPRVETGQAAEFHRIQAEQTKRLSEYRWVDREQGLVQIPIERAMQLLAAEGAQAYAPLAPIQALASPSAGAERATTPEAEQAVDSQAATAPAGARAPAAPAKGQQP
jgi:hypothetical protein